MGSPISIWGCVRPSVHRSDGWSFGWFVTCFFFKCRKWTIFFRKIIGAVQIWHCWMRLMFLMCLMCLKYPRTHRWPAGPCFFVTFLLRQLGQRLLFHWKEQELGNNFANFFYLTIFLTVLISNLTFPYTDIAASMRSMSLTLVALLFIFHIFEQR